MMEDEIDAVGAPAAVSAGPAASAAGCAAGASLQSPPGRLLVRTGVATSPGLSPVSPAGESTHDRVAVTPPWTGAGRVVGREAGGDGARQGGLALTQADDERARDREWSPVHVVSGDGDASACGAGAADTRWRVTHDGVADAAPPQAVVVAPAAAFVSSSSAAAGLSASTLNALQLLAEEYDDEGEA